MTVDEFFQLLQRASGELFALDPGPMRKGALLPTPNEVHLADVEAFGRGLAAGLVVLHPGGRFDTADRPTGRGRWGLLSRSTEGGWFNAEYLPQLAAYVRAVLDLVYPSERVLFELPASALQLDLAVLDDDGRVVVLGEAKRAGDQLDRLLRDVLSRFAAAAPDDASKKRGDEARQLAWRLWTVRPDRFWLIGPGTVRSFACGYDPLDLQPEAVPPTAADLRLQVRPPHRLSPPRLV